MTMKGFREQDLADQSGKSFVITGANAGLGFEAARALALKGGRVVLVCRAADKARAAMDKIKALKPDADLAFVEADLGDLESVKAAAAQIEQQPKLDVLINNAGLRLPPLQRTKQGFESQMGVNHFGHFALVGHLIEKIKKDNMRIVVVSSIAHRRGRIDFDDLDAQHSYKTMKRYNDSKLANILFAFELERRLRRSQSAALCVACHPGMAKTEMPRFTPFWIKLLMPLAWPFLNDAAQGAWPLLLAATGREIKGGDYFGPSRLGEMAGPASYARPSSGALDVALAGRLWDLSVKLTGVDPDI